MKHLLLCVLPAALALVACNTQQSAGMSEEMTYDSLVWCDSVVYPGGSVARVDYDCIFPKEGGTALADSIRLWVLEQYSGDAVCEPTQDLAEALKRIGQKSLKDDAAEVGELTKERDSDYPICYEREAKTSVVYDDEQYTTLSFTYYVYLAGAHGSTFVNYATFRKSDGHLMGWDLLSGMSREELTERIKQGLCGYFAVSMDELPACLLFNTIDEDFPLPVTPPYLVADGISIIYQQYEICCYAAGMPTCVIAAAE